MHKPLCCREITQIHSLTKTNIDIISSTIVNVQLEKWTTGTILYPLFGLMMRKNLNLYRNVLLQLYMLKQKIYIYKKIKMSIVQQNKKTPQIFQSDLKITEPWENVFTIPNAQIWQKCWDFIWSTSKMH